MKTCRRLFHILHKISLIGTFFIILNTNCWAVKPEQPDPKLPGYQEQPASITPFFLLNDFKDVDGDTHKSTTWEIADDSQFATNTLVLQVTSTENLTALSLPRYILMPETKYFWRVSFTDSADELSEWSPTQWFITQEDPDADQDNDGVPDKGQGGDGQPYDFDGDGTEDWEQNDIKFLLTPNKEEFVSVKRSTGVVDITNIRMVDANEMSDRDSKPKNMPIGLFNPRITVNNPGDVATIIVYFQNSRPWWVRWYEYSVADKWELYWRHSTFAESRQSVTLQFKDGGYGDTDGLANGVIVNMTGYHVSELEDSPLEAEDGCFINVLNH